MFFGGVFEKDKYEVGRTKDEVRSNFRKTDLSAGKKHKATRIFFLREHPILRPSSFLLRPYFCFVLAT
jgi:hypothetical protein